jgi:hypothetical protein
MAEVAELMTDAFMDEVRETGAVPGLARTTEIFTAVWKADPRVQEAGEEVLGPFWHGTMRRPVTRRLSSLGYLLSRPHRPSFSCVTVFVLCLLGGSPRLSPELAQL